MPNFNSVELMGFMARDSEIKYANGGLAFCNGTIRVKERYGAGDEEINFFNFSYAGDQAEKYFNKLKKGNGLFISGKLRHEKWESKRDGEKKTGVRIIATRIIVLSENGSDRELDHHDDYRDESGIRELPSI